jgi:hypothetical protein
MPGIVKEYVDRQAQLAEETFWREHDEWVRQHPQLALARTIHEILREDDRLTPQEAIFLSSDEVTAIRDERDLLYKIAEQINDTNRRVNLSTAYDVEGAPELTGVEIYKHVAERHAAAINEIMAYRAVGDAVSNGVIDLDKGEAALGNIYAGHRTESYLQDLHDASLGGREALDKLHNPFTYSERPISLDEYERIRERSAQSIEPEHGFGFGL